MMALGHAKVGNNAAARGLMNRVAAPSTLVTIQPSALALARAEAVSKLFQA
jgi:hypothetical protein